MAAVGNEVDIDSLKDVDQETWADIYDIHVHATYAYIASLLNRNREVIEDVHQQTWLAAISSIDQFEPERGEFRAWLFGIARNRAASYRRQQGREQSRTYIDSSANEVDFSPDVIERAERASVIRSAMHSLSEDAQNVLVGKYIENLSVEELSKQLGKTPKAIESLLSRTRQKMRNLLSQYFPQTRSGT